MRALARVVVAGAAAAAIAAAIESTRTATLLAAAESTAARVPEESDTVSDGARRVQFGLVVTVPGRYGSYSPWSPSGPLFAYSDDKGVVVLDLAQTPPKSVRVASGFDADCTWSPDGAWVLARTPPRTADAQGAALIVVPAAGGAATVVADAVLVSDFIWATDGTIYYWDYQSPKAHAIKPPAVWARDHPGPFAGRPILVFVFGGGAPAAAYFDARTGAAARPLAALANLPRSVLRADGFPDGRLLVRVSGDLDGGHGVNYIFGTAGSVTARMPAMLEGHTFAATAVSADGKTIAGEQVADTEDGILSATLRLMAVDGAWNARIEGVGWGMNPRLSRVGPWLAFTDADGHTHVGTLAPRL